MLSPQIFQRSMKVGDYDRWDQGRQLRLAFPAGVDTP
jgi:hypothetical protein